MSSKIIDAILGSQSKKTDGSAILVFKVKYRDGTEGEDRVCMDRLAIENKCLEYAERVDIVEVTVYEKIFHHVKSDRTGGAHTGESKRPGLFDNSAPTPVSAAGD